ncbi:hypothetical protein EOL70_16815 [Leucothrix sargassi]|nr:hypothetical protein EOL70_16815 [Leucothrix sargassi]
MTTRPDVKKLLRKGSLDSAIEEVKRYINAGEGNGRYLANIDLLRLYGKALRREDFYEQALLIISEKESAVVYRELSRFAYFIDKSPYKARKFAKKALSISMNEPFWLCYVAGVRKTYFTKLCDHVFLTAIPKNASTSLKAMVLEEVFQKNSVNPHAKFGSPFFSNGGTEPSPTEDDLKLLCLREPIARFLSYYNKNIIEENSLSKECGSKVDENNFGLSLRPTLDEFVSKLNIYCYMFNDVIHHVLPQTAYFSGLEQYSNIVNIEDSNVLGSIVAKKLGIENNVVPPRKMKSNKSVSRISVSSEIKEKLDDLFRDDIEMYKSRNVDVINFSFNFSSY